MTKLKPSLCFAKNTPFHFSFRPASHQIKSTLTNIVTHPRSTFFGKQIVCYKKASSCSPSPPQAQGEGRGAFPSLWLSVSTALLLHPGRGSPNELSLPTSQPHVYLSTVVVWLFQLCSHGSQSLRGSCSPHLPELLPVGSSVPSPALQDTLFHLAVQKQRAQREGLVPWSSWLGTVPATGTSKAAAQETLSATYLAAQCNLIINLEALQQKKSTHCSCSGVSLPC